MKQLSIIYYGRKITYDLVLKRTNRSNTFLGNSIRAADFKLTPNYNPSIDRQTDFMCHIYQLLQI